MSGQTVRIGRGEDVAEGQGTRVRLDGYDIALWRVQGRLHAIANTCPHQHVSALHSGTLEDRCVTCPMHGWSFSLETGLAVLGNGRVRVYPVREEDGWVELTLPTAGEQSSWDLTQ